MIWITNDLHKLVYLYPQRIFPELFFFNIIHIDIFLKIYSHSQIVQIHSISFGDQFSMPCDEDMQAARQVLAANIKSSRT